MGIKDLLQAISAVVEVANISEFAGQRIAIDASGWLHKGLYGAAEDYVDSNFFDNQLYVDFILSRVRHFLMMGVEPVVVFDGRRSILKSGTNEKRGETRRTFMEQGRRLLDNMDKVSDAACKAKFRAEAINNFQRGLSVTAQMEKYTLSALRKMGVKVVVSPYEADAQLAYLCHTGYCQAVLTEDSDILVYSAICGTPFKVLYKFDKSGIVQAVSLDSLMPLMSTVGAAAASISPATGITIRGSDTAVVKKEKKQAGGRGRGKDKDSAAAEPKLKGFLNLLKLHFTGPDGRRMFVQMCVLAGCDYSESVPSVGLTTALQAVVRCRHGGNDSRLDRICGLFRSLKKNIPDSYLARAKRAEALFHYHPVFDIDTGTVVPFTPPRFEDMQAASAAELTANNLTSLRTVKPEPGMGAHAQPEPRARSNTKNTSSADATCTGADEIDDGSSEDEEAFSTLPSQSKKRRSLSPSDCLSSTGGSADAEDESPGLEFYPPVTTQQDQAEMGNINNGQDLLRAAPEHIRISDLCLGIVSIVSYEVIPACYPWETRGLEKPPGSNSHKSGGSSYWSVRRALMQAEAAHSGLSIQVAINNNVREMKPVPTPSHLRGMSSGLGVGLGAWVAKPGASNVAQSTSRSASSANAITHANLFDSGARKPFGFPVFEGGKGGTLMPQSAHVAHVKHERSSHGLSSSTRRSNSNVTGPAAAFVSGFSSGTTALGPAPAPVPAPSPAPAPAPTSASLSASVILPHTGAVAGYLIVGDAGDPHGDPVDPLCGAAFSSYISDDESRSCMEVDAFAYEVPSPAVPVVSTTATTVSSSSSSSSSSSVSDSSDSRTPARGDLIMSVFDTPSTASSRGSRSSLGSSTSTIPTPEIPASRMSAVSDATESGPAAEAASPIRPQNPFKKLPGRMGVHSPLRKPKSPEAGPISQLTYGCGEQSGSPENNKNSSNSNSAEAASNPNIASPIKSNRNSTSWSPSSTSSSSASGGSSACSPIRACSSTGGAPNKKPTKSPLPLSLTVSPPAQSPLRTVTNTLASAGVKGKSKSARDIVDLTSTSALRFAPLGKDDHNLYSPQLPARPGFGSSNIVGNKRRADAVTVSGRAPKGSKRGNGKAAGSGGQVTMLAMTSFFSSAK